MSYLDMLMGLWYYGLYRLGILREIDFLRHGRFGGAKRRDV